MLSVLIDMRSGHRSVVNCISTLYALILFCSIRRSWFQSKAFVKVLMFSWQKYTMNKKNRTKLYFYMFIINGDVSCNFWLDMLLLTLMLQQVIDQHASTRWYWSVLPGTIITTVMFEYRVLTDTLTVIFSSAESHTREAECIFFFCPDRWILKVNKLSWRLIDDSGEIRAESQDRRREIFPKVVLEDPEQLVIWGRRNKHEIDGWMLDLGCVNPE